MLYILLGFLLAFAAFMIFFNTKNKFAKRVVYFLMNRQGIDEEVDEEIEEEVRRSMRQRGLVIGRTMKYVDKRIDEIIASDEQKK